MIHFGMTDDQRVRPLSRHLSCSFGAPISIHVQCTHSLFVVRRLIVFICLFQQSGVWRCRTISAYALTHTHNQNQIGTDTHWKFSCSQAIIVLFLFSISLRLYGYRPTLCRSILTTDLSLNSFFQYVPKTKANSNQRCNLVLHLHRVCNFSWILCVVESFFVHFFCGSCGGCWSDLYMNFVFWQPRSSSSTQQR